MTKEYPPHAERKRIVHGIDVLVPSETAQFDSMSEPDPSLQEGREKLTLQMARIRVLAKAFLHSKGGPLGMLEELYIQKVVMQARMAIYEKAFEKLGVSLAPADALKETAGEIEKLMDLEQMANKIIITPDGIYRGE